jgi:integrase
VLNATCLTTAGPLRAERQESALCSDSRLLDDPARWIQRTAHPAGEIGRQRGGAPLHPDYLTRRFRQLVGRSGLPPVRLHDLRHGAASLAHSAGADLKTVQDQLGHTSIVLTAVTISRKEDVIRRLLAHHAEQTRRAAERVAPPPAPGYRPEALEILFGTVGS